MSLTPRQLAIATAVLQVLDQTREYVMPETALRPQVNLQLRPIALQFEFEGVLMALEGQKLVTGVRDEMSGCNRWHITDLGTIKLREWIGA